MKKPKTKKEVMSDNTMLRQMILELQDKLEEKERKKKQKVLPPILVKDLCTVEWLLKSPYNCNIRYFIENTLLRLEFGFEETYNMAYEQKQNLIKAHIQNLLDMGCLKNKELIVTPLECERSYNYNAEFDMNKVDKYIIKFATEHGYKSVNMKSHKFSFNELFSNALFVYNDPRYSNLAINRTSDSKCTVGPICGSLISQSKFDKIKKVFIKKEEK